MATVLLILLFSIVAYASGTFPPSFTILYGAVAKGAVCLNGSAPVYQLDPGYGDGSSNWIVHLEGGGWCHDLAECLGRWRYYNTTVYKWYGGIQSPDPSINPYFYNWNRVFVRYCDGGSFMADVEEVDPKTQIYYRGGRIFKAVVEDLLERGMKQATNVILSGNSAGGLAAMLHCDQFRDMVSQVPRVKCVADSGFFIHGNNGLAGLDMREGQVFAIVKQHQLVNQLPKSCTSKMDPRLITNRTRHSMANWDKNCYQKEECCTSQEHKIIQDFRLAFLEALPQNDSTTRGMFIDARQIHDHITGDVWNFRPDYELNNKTIAEAVAEWFFDKNCFRGISGEDFPVREKDK